LRISFRILVIHPAARAAGFLANSKIKNEEEVSMKFLLFLMKLF